MLCRCDWFQPGLRRPEPTICNPCPSGLHGATCLLFLQPASQQHRLLKQAPMWIADATQLKPELCRLNLLQPQKGTTRDWPDHPTHRHIPCSPPHMPALRHMWDRSSIDGDARVSCCKACRHSHSQTTVGCRLLKVS